MTIPTKLEPCVDQLRRHFAGRKVILAMGPVAGSGRAAQRLLELGSERPLVLGECVGTGALPTAEEVAGWHVVGEERATSIMDAVRSFVAGLVRLPPDVAEAIERYDPDRAALVLTANYLDLQTIAGRPVFGAREPAWAALEDKVVVDELWDRAGVPRAPSRIVPARDADLRAASTQLDRGAGTVWAADARDGFHGGGDGTRWLQPDADPAPLIAFMRERADHVRVMPFLEGIPCGIHGIVMPDHVIALRPVEQITLRRRGEARFHYGGTATFWDPSEADRAAMRALAVDTGERLRADVDYRGAFTIDGVLTVDGFFPTELNPRFGAGLSAIQPAIRPFPAYFFNLAIMAGALDDLDARAIESVFLSAADDRRGGGAKGLDTTVRETTEEHQLVERDDGGFELAGDRTPDATVTIGPAPMGCLVLFEPDHERTPVGPSFAPRAAAALRWADEQLGTQFGALEAAPSVR